MDILVEFYKYTAGGIETIESWFNSGIFRPTSKINFDEQVYSELTNTISKKIEQFTCQSSGWTINKLKEMNLKIVKYDPIKASSYIELPEKFTNSKFKLVNIKNTDNECFKWAVARFFCADEKHSERISKKLKKEAEKFNFEGIEFPMKLNKIYIFEKNNQISINVFSFNDKLELYPLRITQQNFEPSINLLLITNEENSHYVLMKSLRGSSPLESKMFIIVRRALKVPYIKNLFLRNIPFSNRKRFIQRKRNKGGVGENSRHSFFEIQRRLSIDQEM